MDEKLASVRVDTESKVPPYEQIRAAVAGAAARGDLPVGTKLPPVRALAEELSVAVNTAARAYRELEQAGVVETRGRSGTFVAAGGDRQREAARAAARDYADVIAGLGIDRAEAVEIARAALER